MNLYLFPEAACSLNGYGVAVEAAYKRFDIKDEDEVVWITTVPRDKMRYLRDKDHILVKPRQLSVKSIVNTLRQTNRSEPWLSDLSYLKGMSFENIYCDETLFYPAIRKLFPKQKLTVRFHNSFARIHDRLKLLQRNVDLKYKITLHNMYRLERDVMNDENVFKIFLSDEDRYYYTSHYGKLTDSSVFGFHLDLDKAKANRIELALDNRIIWYGGVESHKKSSIEWFIRDVFPVIKKAFPDLEFHLWGNNTAQFDSPADNIFGHGFFDGDNMPSSSSLYINPDIIGGGVKIKLMSMLEAGVPVISSPFGFEGYKQDIVDQEYCIVQEERQWAQFIIDYYRKHSVITGKKN